MAFGIFLFSDKDSESAKLIAKYLSPKAEPVEITAELLNKISLKHDVFSNSANPRKMLSYRHDSVKFFSSYVEKRKTEEHVFVVFVLNLKESSEPFSIMMGELKQSLSVALDAYQTDKNINKIQDILKQALDSRNEWVDDLKETKRIQEKIVQKANKLLDDANFESAQSLIKLAKEIPPKISDMVNRGDEAFGQANYRVAQKLYSDAADLSDKISQNAIAQLLRKKATRADEIPKFTKTWALLYDQICKPLKKMDKREVNFYMDPSPTVNQAIEVSDMLEDDNTIYELEKLDDLLHKAEQLSKELDKTDVEIKKTLEKLRK